MTESLEDFFGPVMFAYTRAEAIGDGVLVDVSAMAKECGFKIPVATTAAVWDAYVDVPPGVEAQDMAGRLWDVLFMLRHAINSDRKNDHTEMSFQLYVRNHNRDALDDRDLVTLKSLCGPGDDAEPVITIMLPDED